MHEWSQRIKRASETSGTHVIDLRSGIEESIDIITGVYAAMGVNYFEIPGDPKSFKELFLRNKTVAIKYGKKEVFSNCWVSALTQHKDDVLQRVVNILLVPTGIIAIITCLDH